MLKRLFGRRSLLPVVTAVVAVAIAGCASAPQTHTPAEIYDLVSPAVVAVATPYGVGSGVSINGWIVTNAHVVWPFRSVSVRFPGEEPTSVTVAHVDLTADLALLGPVRDVPTLAISPRDPPAAGENVYLVGYPADNEANPLPSISAGIVSRMRHWETMDLTYIQTDAAASAGQSGGILLDASAEIIGVSGHVLGVNDFALSLSTNDLLAVIDRMEAGPTLAEVLETRGFERLSSREHDDILENEWDFLELGLLDGYSSLEVSVESEMDVDVSLVDSFGNYLEYVDGVVEGEEILRAEQLPDEDFIVVVEGWDSGGAVHLRSNVGLYRKLDPDDGQLIVPGTSTTAVIDHANDLDYFYIDLTEGTTTTIVVESIMMNPYLSLDMLGETYPIEDDDSGGGILGVDSKLTVRSTTSDRFVIVVFQAQTSFGGGYVVRVESRDDLAAGATPYPSSLFQPASPEGDTTQQELVDPEDIGAWGYFRERPVGWVEDTEFFAASLDATLNRSLRFGGGLPVPGGYDPIVTVFAFPAPRSFDLGSFVDENVIGIQQKWGKLESRSTVKVRGQSAEQIRWQANGMFIAQTYIVLDSTIWIVQFGGSTNELVDSCLGLLESFDPDLVPSGLTTTQVDPRDQFRLEMGAALSSLDLDDVQGSIETITSYRDRAVETFGPEDEITIFLQVGLASVYFEQLNQYDDAIAILSEIVDLTPENEELRELLASFLNEIAWIQRNNADVRTFLHFSERSVELSRSLHGHDASRTLGNQHTLGIIQHYSGDTSAAIATLESVVRTYESAHAVDRKLVGCWLDLAHLYGVMGRDEEAEELRERARESRIEPPSWSFEGMPARLQLLDQDAIDQLYLQIMEQIKFMPGPYPEAIPEGISAYYGEYTCAQGLAGSVTVIFRSGGDITSIRLNGGPRSQGELDSAGHHRAVGTYNPATNRFTEVPDEWLVPKPGWIVDGRDGVYISETGSMEGASRTAETYLNGEPLCLDFQLAPIYSNPGTEVLAQYGFISPRTNDGTPVALPLGTTRWAGGFSCAGNHFQLTLELRNQGSGILTCTFSHWETGTAASDYAFSLQGTHNEETGRLSLAPVGWIGGKPPSLPLRMYFVDGHHLASPSRLMVRLITGNGPCNGEAIVALYPVTG